MPLGDGWNQILKDFQIYRPVEIWSMIPSFTAGFFSCFKAKERDYEELLLLSHDAYHAKEGGGALGRMISC